MLNVLGWSEFYEQCWSLMEKYIENNRSVTSQLLITLGVQSNLPKKKMRKGAATAKQSSSNKSVNYYNFDYEVPISESHNVLAIRHDYGKSQKSLERMTHSFIKPAMLNHDVSLGILGNVYEICQACYIFFGILRAGW